MNAGPTSAAILSIAYYLPEKVCTNAELISDFSDLDIERIASKTGIVERHIAATNETSSDLAVAAAEKMFINNIIDRSAIDFVILCTQSPDYFLPPSSCIIQDRLKLGNRTGAIDVNLGCSGFVYGLGLAKALIETHQAKNVLLLTAETYSKFVAKGDHTTRTIFGDGAAAALIGSVAQDTERGSYIGRPLYGTDGRGAENLIVRRGGLRMSHGGVDADSFLHMNGPELFLFAIDKVASSIQTLLAETRSTVEEVDLFVPHQANAFMLESLSVKLGFPRSKLSIQCAETGNTVSASIPIALAKEVKAKRLGANAKVLLAGFGVGYSWASVLLRWHPDFRLVS